MSRLLKRPVTGTFTYATVEVSPTTDTTDLVVNGGSLDLYIFQVWASFRIVPLAPVDGQLCIMDNAHNQVIDPLAASSIDNTLEGNQSHEIGWVCPVAGQGLQLRAGECLCFKGVAVNMKLVTAGVVYGS